SLVVGLAASVACAVGAAGSVEQFLRSYLAGYLLWWGIAVGCLGLTMLTHLISSDWGQTARPYFITGIGTLPLLAILFLPIAFGLDRIYEWANDDLVRADPLLQKKAAYLNRDFFQVHAAGYFAVWLIGGWLLRRNEPARAVRLSGSGLVLLVLTT